MDNTPFNNVPDVKKLDDTYQKKINRMLKECFNTTRAFDYSRIHFGRFELVSYLNVIPLTVEIQGEKYNVGGICSVSTLPSFRNQGSAQELLKAVLNWMRDNGYDIAALYVSDERLYNKLGFVKAPEVLKRKNFDVYSGGSPYLFMMAKHLHNPDFDLFPEESLENWKKLDTF